MTGTKKSAELLVATIEATGGVVQFGDGTVAPQGDPEWIDLGEAYLVACAELQRLPMVQPDLESHVDSVEERRQEDPTMVRICTLLIVSDAHLTRGDQRALTWDGYRRGDFGWLLRIDEDAWPMPERVPPSAGLAGAILYARLHGCTYLLFDEPGSILPGIQIAE
jgi:hypothetical protein